MDSNQSTVLDGDSGSWESSDKETNDEAIFESPELHLFIKGVGSILVLLFLIVFFGSMAGYGVTIALISTILFMGLFSMFPLFLLIDPKSGNIRQELKRFSDNGTSFSPTLEREVLTSEQVLEEMDSKRVVSDIEIAIKYSSSIGTTRSRLLHLAGTESVECKNVGNRIVCWKVENIDSSENR